MSSDAWMRHLFARPQWTDIGFCDEFIIVPSHFYVRVRMPICVRLYLLFNYYL